MIKALLERVRHLGVFLSFFVLAFLLIRTTPPLLTFGVIVQIKKFFDRSNWPFGYETAIFLTSDFTPVPKAYLLIYFFAR